MEKWRSRVVLEVVGEMRRMAGNFCAGYGIFGLGESKKRITAWVRNLADREFCGLANCEKFNKFVQEKW